MHVLVSVTRPDGTSFTELREVESVEPSQGKYHVAHTADEEEIYTNLSWIPLIQQYPPGWHSASLP